eukprot:521259-Ditylum_brightwellii.AAC.1
MNEPKGLTYSKNAQKAKKEKCCEKISKMDCKLVNSEQQICAMKELKRSLGKHGSLPLNPKSKTKNDISNEDAMRK